MAKDRPISRQQMPQHRNPAADTEAPRSLIADADTKTKEEKAAEDSTSVDPDTPVGDHDVGSGIRPGQAESDAAAAMHGAVDAIGPNLQGLVDQQSLSLDDDPAAHLGDGQLSDADVLAGLLPDGPTNGDGTQSSAGDGSGGGAGHSPTSSGGLGSSLGLGPQQPQPVRTRRLWRRRPRRQTRLRHRSSRRRHPRSRRVRLHRGQRLVDHLPGWNR